MFGFMRGTSGWVLRHVFRPMKCRWRCHDNPGSFWIAKEYKNISPYVSWVRRYSLQLRDSNGAPHAETMVLKGGILGEWGMLSAAWSNRRREPTS